MSHHHRHYYVLYIECLGEMVRGHLDLSMTSAAAVVCLEVDISASENSRCSSSPVLPVLSVPR